MSERGGIVSSLVARHFGVVEVVGSNPAAPIDESPLLERVLAFIGLVSEFYLIHSVTS